MPPDFCIGTTMVEYVLPYKGLAIGNHEYSFKIDNTFFKNFEYLEIEGGLVDLELELVKESTLLNLEFRFGGTVEIKCDRCLDNFKMDVNGNFRLIVKFADEYEEISDEVITIPSKENNLDISQFVYEYLNLMLPLQKIHPDDDEGYSTCNSDMLNRIDNYSEQKTDPRWDALKNIKFDRK